MQPLHPATLSHPPLPPLPTHPQAAPDCLGFVPDDQQQQHHNSNPLIQKQNIKPKIPDTSGNEEGGSSTPNNPGGVRFRKKLPYSNITLIVMAIQASPTKRCTLNQIYQFLQQKFCYFKDESKNWKNSIRHTLSFNKCFIKIPKRPDECLKTPHYWTTDYTIESMTQEGSLRRRPNGCGVKYKAQKKPFGMLNNKGDQLAHQNVAGMVQGSAGVNLQPPNSMMIPSSLNQSVQGYSTGTSCPMPSIKPSSYTQLPKAESHQQAENVDLAIDR